MYVCVHIYIYIPLDVSAYSGLYSSLCPPLCVCLNRSKYVHVVGKVVSPSMISATNIVSNTSSTEFNLDLFNQLVDLAQSPEHKALFQ
jgi:hypothetical protein